MATNGRQHSQEFRLGLVMYGGVSLAIYINGVANEFFRAVRGRGVYKLLQALTDSDVVVDIVSGTSAGGINGILLAYALCNEKEFGDCAALWRDYGDIGSLLRPPREDERNTTALLDSTYFQERIAEAFRNMRDCPAGEAHPRPQELDLFVTGTNVDGEVYTTFDDAGHAIEIKDHRSVFILKHRQGRKTPFEPVLEKARDPAVGREVTPQSLAKLARITACFPAAFTPVAVGRDDPSADDNAPLWRAVDERLIEWGDLRDPAWFLDGGVLDNKPFTHTLREIFFRVAERDVDRKLFYVEPDPERIRAVRRTRAPHVVQSVLLALIGIPGYESIAEDLKLLNARNSKLESYLRFREAVRAELRERRERDGEPAVPGDDEPTKTAAFVEAVRRWEAQPGSEGSAERALESGYARSRLTALGDRVITGILHRRVGGALDPDTRVLAGSLRRQFHAQLRDGFTVLAQFDAEFRLRRLAHVIYACPSIDPGDGDPADGEETARFRTRLLHSLNRQWKLLEVLKAGMERVVDNAPFRWRPDQVPELWRGPDAGAEVARGIWRDVDTALRHLLNVAEGGLLPAGYTESWRADADPPSPWLDQDQLSGVNRELRARADAIAAALGEGHLERLRPAAFQSALRETDLAERRMLERLLGDGAGEAAVASPFRSLRDEYHGFVELDAQLFPVELLADLREKDIIETIRISPVDAQLGFSRRAAEDKVSGDALHHFGGFFKRSWRANDILWGRLDGLCQLGETLLTRERLARVLARGELRGALRARLDADLDPAALFPSAGRKTQERLRSWLADLTAKDAGTRARALEEAAFRERRELLIEAAQLEVLQADVPSVVEDAVREQVHWNQYRLRKRGVAPVPVRYDAREDHFESGEGDLDPLVVTAASHKLARDAVAEIRRATADSGSGADRPADTPMGTFFSKDYAVGAESLWKNVPTVVLLRVLADALPVARNALLHALGGAATRVKRTFSYKLASLSLAAFRALVDFLGRSSAAQQVFAGAITVIAALLLAVGLNWWEAIVGPWRDLSWLSLLVFIVLPLLVLGAELYLLARRWRVARKAERAP